jgi:transcription antitermination factor NusA-like protein
MGGVDALSLFLTLSLSLIILKCLFILGKRNCFVSSLQKSKEHTFERKKILFIEHHPDHAELIIDVLETKNVEKEINLMKDDCKLLIIFRKIGVG